MACRLFAYRVVPGLARNSGLARDEETHVPCLARNSGQAREVKKEDDQSSCSESVGSGSARERPTSAGGGRHGKRPRCNSGGVVPVRLKKGQEQLVCRTCGNTINDVDPVCASPEHGGYFPWAHYEPFYLDTLMAC